MNQEIKFVQIASQSFRGGRQGIARRSIRFQILVQDDEFLIWSTRGEEDVIPIDKETINTTRNILTGQYAGIG